MPDPRGVRPDKPPAVASPSEELTAPVVAPSIPARPVRNDALHARVEHNMTLQPPAQEVLILFERLRAQFKTTAHLAIDICPETRELSLALTELEDGLQHCIAAIARNQQAAILMTGGVVVTNLPPNPQTPATNLAGQPLRGTT